MTDTDLHRQIISLLKRGPYMRQEIARYCRPHADADVQQTLLAMERSGTVRYLPAVDLYALVAE